MLLYIHRPVWMALGCSTMSTPAKTLKMTVTSLWRYYIIKGCHSCSWLWKPHAFLINLCSCEPLCCSDFFLCFQMWKGFENGGMTPYSEGYIDHITEVQNGWDWKGSLEVIQANPPAQTGPPTAGCFHLLALLANQFLFLILICPYFSSWKIWEPKFFNSGCFLSVEIFIFKIFLFLFWLL